MYQITDKHPEYERYQNRWEFYLRSYMGAEDYQDGGYLTSYLNESKDEYGRRIQLTPIDNHCKGIVHIYSSYLWRVPPVRVFGALANNPALSDFLKDSDLDGRSFNSFMREAQQWASVYGHVWIMVDKPQSQVGTRAQELEQGIRPYLTMITPENVFDWNYERSASGRYELTYLKVRESIDRKDDTHTITHFRKWYLDRVELWEYDNDNEKLVETVPNMLGKIPAVHLPANRSNIRGVGISDIADIAHMQKAIYEELSEIEQLIRISNHPTLVKTYDTDASAGAGAVINFPDDMDGNLKPYMLQPDGGNLDAVRASITDKVTTINRMAHMGAVRGTDAVKASGIALQTEFQLLNSKLSEKADVLELAEEQVWRLFCLYQEVSPDVEIYYPDSFDVKDYPNELQFLQMAKASGVRSTTLMQEIDKQIADLILDDEKLARAHVEIEQNTVGLGDFNKQTQIYKYHIDAGIVSANEVRDKIGLDDVDGGDELLERASNDQRPV
jgi:hypothetical protein